MPETQPTPAVVEALAARLVTEAESGGYHINPDSELVGDLAEGLLVNQRRYGYQSCPCRLATGDEADDRDMVCPCDYRDPDLDEFDTCYCGLYVSQTVVDGEKKAGRIPERRPPSREERAQARKQHTAVTSGGAPGRLAWPVWRCSVCGYLCARDHPPGICPVCKAKKDRFEQFM